VFYTSVHPYIYTSLFMVKFLKSNLFFLLLLTIVIFSLYGKSISFDFTYHDDDALILEKSSFLSDIKNIPKIFTTSCYYSKDFQYYRPILNLSFLIETSIFGLNIKVYHTTNIILFILALYLMYVFLLKLKLNESILKFIIILVSVHPILTSTVVWIPARNDTLLAIFIFLSFIFFIKYLENNNLQNLILYILFWAIALFTKETAILILILYPLFMYCFNYKLSKKEIIKNILILVPILIAYFYLRNISVAKVNINNYLINYKEYIYNIIYANIMYIYELITVNVYFALYKIKLEFIPILIFFISILIIGFIFIKKIIDRKQLVFLLVWFFMILFPTFFQNDYTFLNHRIFISFMSIVFILIKIIEEFIKKYNMLNKYFIIVFSILFVSLLFISFNFSDVYKNKYTFWTNAYKNVPKYHPAPYWMYKLFLENGDLNNAKKFLEEANKFGNNRYISDLALIYYQEGNFDKAEELYKQSIQLGINKAQCYRNLSVIYRKRDNDINKSIGYAKLAIKEKIYDVSYKQYLDKLIKLSNEKDNL